MKQHFKDTWCHAAEYLTSAQHLVDYATFHASVDSACAARDRYVWIITCCCREVENTMFGACHHPNKVRFLTR